MQDKPPGWMAHVQGWQASGVSQAAYCRAQGLSLASFGYWRRKLAGEAPPVSAAVLPIQVAPAVRDPSTELCLRNGIVLRMAVADPAWLASLLRALGAC